MPLSLPSDTANALGNDAARCDSRSLLMERFVDPAARERDRRDVFLRAMRARALPVKASSWTSLCPLPPHTRAGEDPPSNHRLFAQLQSRLLVNMAGGVMENAGLCLDRFGMPNIPGSAVKGCARRLAMQTLLEADSQQAKTDLLVSIARVFGWVESDWQAGRRPPRRDRPGRTEAYSDFWWAMSSEFGEGAGDPQRDELWSRIAPQAAMQLLDLLRVSHRDHPTEPWRDLPNYAGCVSFWPAYPVDLGRTGHIDGLPLEVPSTGALELDVVTCHHREYYASTNPHAVATDTEEPVPVVFPAVAPGQVFAFILRRLRDADAGTLRQAVAWLTRGLETFGLGAKTNAGYGWFDASEAVRDAVIKTEQENSRKAHEERERAEMERQRKADEERLHRLKQERAAALAGLSGDALADKEIEILTDPQFDAKVRAFWKVPKKGGPTEDQKRAIVRALRGSRVAYWQRFKAQATKGDLASAKQAIDQLSKQMFPGKEGKMP